MTQDRIKALEDALRTKAAMIELGEKIAWGSDVALMREAADALAAIQPAADCHQPDLVTAQPAKHVQPGAPVTLTYTNWKGETALRTIIPRHIWWGFTYYHPEPQWLLTAFDVDTEAERDFALKDFGKPAQPLTVQDAARVPEIAALIEAAKLVHDSHWYSADGVVTGLYDLAAAMRAIAEGK